MTRLTILDSRIVARIGQREVVLAIVPAAHTERVAAREVAHKAIAAGSVTDWRRVGEACGLITRMETT